MPLADLLQWVEATGKSGTVTIQRATHTFAIQLESRHITALGRPHCAPHTPELPEASSPWQPLPLVERCLATLIDQFLDSQDPFSFEERSDTRATDHLGLLELVSIEPLHIQAAVMEGMRHRDEWPQLRTRFEDPHALLRRVGKGIPPETSPLQLALLACAAYPMTIDEAGLRLGLSRPATLRGLAPLQQQGLVELDPAPAHTDPPASHQAWQDDTNPE